MFIENSFTNSSFQFLALEALNIEPNPILIYTEKGDLFYINQSAKDFFPNCLGAISKVNLFEYSNSLGYDYDSIPSNTRVKTSFSYSGDTSIPLAENNFGLEFSGEISKLAIDNTDCYAVFVQGSPKNHEKDLFHSLIESANILSDDFPDVLIMTDIETRIVWVSKSAEQIWGYSSDEAIGMRALDLFYEDDRAEAHQNLQKMLERDLGPKTYRVVTKNGSVKLFEINGKLLRDEKNLPFGTIFIVRDVSSRFEFEERLRLSEAQNRALLNNLPFRIWLKDVDGNYLSANESLAVVFDTDVEEVIGKNDFDFFTADEAELYAEEHSNIVRLGSIYNYEREYIEFSQKKWLEVFKAPVFDEKDIIIGSFGYARDITEKKMLELELKESETLFRTLILTSPDGICISDLEGNISFASLNAYSMFGYDRSEDMENVNILSLIMPSFRQDLEERILSVNNGEKVSYSEYMAQKNDGECFWIEGVAELFVDPIERQNKIFFTIRDITERKNYLEEQDRLLEQVSLSKIELESALFEKNSLIEDLAESERLAKNANAEKDKFFSIIAHDLKNPFSGFLGLTQELSESLLDMPMRDMQLFTRQLQESARNLYSLLENLLEWSRAQRGIITLEPEFAPLQYLIKNNIEIINGKASQKDITIENLSDNIYIYADVNMLNGILRNLISNAVKFSHRGSVIKVYGKQIDEEWAQISIKDSGVGIAIENIPKLFRIDEKLSTQGTEGEPSTGLGLLLCKEFVDKHDGKIWVESKEGEGSEFCFTMPFKNSEIE